MDKLTSKVLDQDGSGVRPFLAQTGVNVNGLRSSLDKVLDSLAQLQGSGGQLHVSNELERLLNLTDRKAQKRGRSVHRLPDLRARYARGKEGLTRRSHARQRRELCNRREDD